MSELAADRTSLSHLRHDLRTPLNQIIGYSELLLEETGDAGHSVYGSDLQKIRGAAKTLLNLINDNLTDQRLTLSEEIVESASVGLRPADAEDAETPLLPARAAVPGRILVVDDNPENRDMLARQLERQGHGVSSA